jgi:NitT/TauT family transport system ATP-binding protein
MWKAQDETRHSSTIERDDRRQEPTMGRGPALIEVDNLRKIYNGRTESVVALEDVSFTIGEREFVSIVGPSGCGKSTLLKILAGLIPKTSGRVRIGARDVAGSCRDTGFVFQAPVLLPWRTVLENVLLPIEVSRLPKEKFGERAAMLLRLVGLEGFEQRYPFELSGGMQQRASIVRALVHDPRMLLMDEPFGALDAMTREQMNVETLRIWQSSGKTIVFVTHSISEAVFMSDRVLVMTPRPGRLAAVIDIDLPRPRDLTMINSDRFGVYASRIRELLNAKGDLS